MYVSARKSNITGTQVFTKRISTQSTTAHFLAALNKFWILLPAMGAKFFIGWLAYLDSEAFGADNWDEDGTYMGFGIVMMKSLKTLGVTRLQRRMLLRALPEPRGGGGLAIIYFSQGFANRFRQIVFPQGSESAKLNAGSGFCKFPHTFANTVPQGFTIFCKFLQFIVSQSFARFSKVLQRVGCFLWAMTRNLVFSKQWSAGTLVDFSLQCELEHEGWYRAKRKLQWNRPRSCSASESLSRLWALVLDLCQWQPKSHFSWRVSRKGDFLSIWRDRQFDTSW